MWAASWHAPTPYCSIKPLATYHCSHSVRPQVICPSSHATCLQQLSYLNSTNSFLCLPLSLLPCTASQLIIRDKPTNTFELAQPASGPLLEAILCLNSPTAAHHLCPGKGKAVPPCDNCLQRPRGSSVSKGTRVWAKPQPIQPQAYWAKHLDSAWANTNQFCKASVLAP
jgi:hypothetical protein